VFSLVLVVAMILASFAGCGQAAAPESDSPATDQPAETTGSMKIGVSVMFSHPFFDTITEGIKSVMEPLGYTVIDKSGEFDVQAQIADVEDFISQECDAIFIEPFDSAGIKPALEAAKKAGIPVICLDSPANDVDLVAANCATDNYDAGVQNAKQLIADLGGKGKIIVLDSPQANSSLLRADGFVETLKAEAPDIEIVSQQDYAGAQDKALQIMGNIIQGQPEVDAIYACNENGILGAIPAVEAAGRADDGILYYTVDGSADFVQRVKDGEVAGVACQQPYQIGVLGAESMLKAMKGETIEKEIKVPVVYVTKDTVGDFKGF
ncbi:MAG TPA: substrate-binding domain-containing protein, partial [Anaerovoracaceae bacterium]|nr:substrate-binding domain-containing protein [Anaerovoracaceae bacterium]